jgi:hypothetical protein
MSVFTLQLERLWRVFLTLPLITQWAVVILLVSAVVVHLFVYGERTVHDGPSIFTTAGIFFTFLGIAEGLYGFDVLKIDTSVPTLLDGLKTAFIASVFGVGAALTIKLRYALFGLPHHATDGKIEGATIDDLHNQMVAVQQAIVGNDDSTLLSQLKLTRQDTNDRLDDLRKSQTSFMETMAENNSKALIQALQEVIRDFNTKISDQFGENFKQLNVAVGKLLEWQENYRSQIAEMIEQQTRSAGSMITATDRYETVVNKAEIFNTLAHQLSNLLSGLETQRAHLDESLKSLGQLLTAASDSLPEIENKIIQFSEQVTSGVKQNQDDMTRTVRDSAVAIQATIADLKSLLLETTQSTNRQINDHIKQLADKTTEQITKLDLALETELSKSISSLGRQLTALSSRFVEDYGPLTDKLRQLVQLPRGV